MILQNKPNRRSPRSGVTIYDWINQWRVERPIDTLRLSSASGWQSKT